MSNDEPTTANGAGQEQQDKHKRVNVWLREDQYNKLRSNLIMQGTSVSEWIRQQIEEFNKQTDIQQYEANSKTI